MPTRYNIQHPGQSQEFLLNHYQIRQGKCHNSQQAGSTPIPAVSRYRILTILPKQSQKRIFEFHVSQEEVEAEERIGHPETLQLSPLIILISKNHLVTPDNNQHYCFLLQQAIREDYGNCVCRSLSKHYKACNPSIKGSHSLVRDGPLPFLVKCTFLNKFPTRFALQYLCGQSNSLFVTTKSLDPISICKILVA